MTLKLAEYINVCRSFLHEMLIHVNVEQLIFLEMRNTIDNNSTNKRYPRFITVPFFW